MNENISNQDNINEDEVKAYIKDHREELDLDNPNKQIDFFEEVEHKLQYFNFEDEFDYKLLREFITGNIRITFNRLMPYYQREDFEKKTETYYQLLKTYRVFKIVSRFCDENKLYGYVSSDIKFPIEFETEYNRLFTDDNKIVLSQNPTQDVRPEVSKSEDTKRTGLAMTEPKSYEIKIPTDLQVLRELKRHNSKFLKFLSNKERYYIGGYGSYDRFLINQIGLFIDWEAKRLLRECPDDWNEITDSELINNLFNELRKSGQGKPNFNPDSEVQPIQTGKSEPIPNAQPKSEYERDKANDSDTSVSNEDRVVRAKVKELAGQNRALKRQLSLKHNPDPNELEKLIDQSRHPKTKKFKYRRLARLIGCTHTTAKAIVERNGLKHLTV